MPIVARLNQYASLQATEFDEVNATKVNVSAAGTFYALEFLSKLLESIHRQTILCNRIMFSKKPLVKLQDQNIQEF